MASRLGELLVRAKVIDELQLRSAIAYQQQWGGRVPHIIVERGFAEVATVTDALAKALRVPRVELDTVTKDASALALLDPQFARERVVFPCALKDHGKTLWVAMADPSDVPTIDDIAALTRCRIRTVISSETEIITAIERHYLGREPTLSPLQFTGYDPMMAADDGEEGKIVNLSGTRIAETPRPDQFATPASPMPAYTPAMATPAANAEGFEFELTPVAPMPVSAPAPAAKPSPARLSPPVGGLAPIAAELLRRAEASAVRFTSDELHRLCSLQDQQKICSSMLRALLDLCLERGVISADEYRARMARA